MAHGRLALVALALALPAAVGAVAGQTPAGPGPSQQEASQEPASQLAGFPAEWVVDRQVVGKRVESQPGDVCLICNVLIAADDLVYLVEGQRVPVHRTHCVGRLLSNPKRWLARLKPRGAFLGARPHQSALLPGIFYAGLYVLLGLIFGGLSAHRAFHAGYSPLAWFGAGFILSVPGYLVLLARPKRAVAALGGVPKGLGKIASTFSPRPCPQCGAANHPSAGQCAGCGAKLTPRITSEVQRAGFRSM